MHLNSSSIGISVLARRASTVPVQTNVIPARYFSASSYSCIGTKLDRKRIFTSRSNNSLVQRRFANTTSGFYAPITSSHRESREPRGNLTVFEESDHLPSLPVPNLNLTLEKLKDSISPVAMNSTEFVNTLRLIDEFANSAGPKLDLLLRNKASKSKNWLTLDWWLKESYLKSRTSLVINSNPSMIYPTLPFEVNNQRSLVNVISELISGIIDFKLALIHGYNPEATSADNECRLDPTLCYSQYKNIFGTTRMPGDRVDTLHKTNILESTNPFNLIVSYRGKFFEIQLNDIEDEKNRIDKIRGILDKIISTGDSSFEGDSRNYQSDDIHSASGAGVLTTANRSVWAEAIKLLDADSINAIKDSQFVVCIDTVESECRDGFLNPLLNSPPGNGAYMAALNRQILHGDNTNVGNRWFDKSLQLIVVADAKGEKYLGAGINYEHSCGEAILPTKLIEYSYDKILQKHRESSSTSNFFAKEEFASQTPAVFRQLRMFDENYAEEINHIIKQIRQDYASQIDQFDLSYFDYKQYGSNAIKSWRFSPDSWFQVAMQAAYYNLHKRLGPCYESASTRRFAYGRTETIRSLTKDVSVFCLEPSYETMQAAIKSHKAYAVSAGNGSAIDRALFGYRMTFKELRSNKWSWGLPTAQNDIKEFEKLAQKQKNTSRISDVDESLSSCEKQTFSIGDLFTEDELNTIGAFFNNELIKRSTRFALSTSQVSSIHPNINMSYGPILKDGYGCSYNITGQKIVAGITANSSNKFFSCEVNEFSSALGNSLDNMKSILEEHRSKS